LDPNDQIMINYVKRVLDEAHIEVDEVIDKKIDIMEEHDIEQHPFGDSKMTRASSASSVMSLANKRPKASMLKLGPSEYHIGRIEYKRPSSAHLSRHGSLRSVHTVKSDVSVEQATSKKDSPTRFFIEEKRHSPNQESSSDYEILSDYVNEHHLDIPEPILEEDEKYMTIQKSTLNNQSEYKPPLASKIFDDQSHGLKNDQDGALERSDNATESFKSIDEQIESNNK
jgi:hypothetical protein